MSHKTIRYISAALIALLVIPAALGHPLVPMEHLTALGALPLLIGETRAIGPNVLELFKNVPFRAGVDPAAAVGIMRDAIKKQIPQEELLAKAFTQPSTATTGLAQYDLEQGAKLIYPITTMFRNMIPRVTGGVGIQSNWRAVTAVNPNKINIGLGEGRRGGVMQQTVVEKNAPFKTSGMDNYVTEQARLAAVTFEDLNALASTVLLQGVMEQEEYLDIGGNNSLALGTCATPTQNSTATTGGGLSDATYSVICVALTYMGMVTSTAPTGQNTSSAAGGAVALPYTRTNLDGTVDTVQGFCGIQSAAASISLSGGGSAQILKVKVAAQRGAIGYAWYVQAGGTGSEKLAMITGYPTADIKYTNSTGQLATALPASDTSTNSLNYDGLLTQILTSGSGGYWADLAGAALTTAGSGSGRIAEIDTALQAFFNTYRLIPTDIFMNVTDQISMTGTVLTGNTNLAPFFMGGSADGGLQASTVLKRYINPIGFGNPYLDVHTHPFIPAGTMMFYSRTNPYPLSNVPGLVRKLCRRDYWQVNWPKTTHQDQIGVYFDAVLQMYFAPAFGVITGIKS